MTFNWRRFGWIYEFFILLRLIHIYFYNIRDIIVYKFLYMSLEEKMWEWKKDDSVKNSRGTGYFLYGIIFFLGAIIFAWIFFLGKSNLGSEVEGAQAEIIEPEIVGVAGQAVQNIPESWEITIRVIDDERCSNCQTAELLTQLRELPFLNGANYIEQDFLDEGVSEFMQENNLTNIPAVVLSTNDLNDNSEFVQYLSLIPSWEYSLALPEIFNPFAKQLSGLFPVIDLELVKSIQASPKNGNPDAPITWIEYADLECPFCARLHTSGTTKTILEDNGGQVNIVFQHFPLDSHPNALSAAQWAECAREQWVDFYALVDASFAKYNAFNLSLNGFYDIAAWLWADKTNLLECVESGKHKDYVLSQFNLGQSLFGVRGTPGNVVINNETGEYAILSWARPASAFQEVIDQMLGE